MLLEVAERFALRSERPRRSVMFVAFDLEESALLGSTHFAAHPPRPIARLKAFLTADMLGRAMADVMREYVFVLGSETAPELTRLLDDTRPESGLKVGRLSADIIGTRGDYGPFRDRRVPFLFFSTGQHPDYHRSTDTPDKLDYAKLERISRWIGELTWKLADADDAPVWSEEPAADLKEVQTILRLVARIEKKQQTLSSSQREMLDGYRTKLRGILQRGSITDSERTWLVWSTRMLLLMVL
jgi:Zn-dependent M28 family amino/carboxypeptidase